MTGLLDGLPHMKQRLFRGMRLIMDNNLEERIEQLEKENELLRNWQQSTNQLISKMIDALNEPMKKQDY